MAPFSGGLVDSANYTLAGVIALSKTIIDLQQIIININQQMTLTLDNILYHLLLNMIEHISHFLHIQVLWPSI